MLKVIGAGFARTGTTSTKGALEELGFGPCYTFVTLFARPEHVDRWLAAYAGQPMNWPDLFADFQATVDWPGCDFYEELMGLYPDAKIVLNVRDPEAWYDSVKNTIWEIHQAEVQAGRGPETDPYSRLREVMIWQRAFGGQFLDKQHAIGVFERHIAQVKDRVPQDKLLVFDVKQGWGPLCRFLDVEVPDKPFPHLMDRAYFHELVRSIDAKRSAEPTTA